MMKSRKISRAENVAHTGGEKCIQGGNPKGRRLLVRHKQRREHNIEIGVTEVGSWGVD